MALGEARRAVAEVEFRQEGLENVGGRRSGGGLGNGGRIAGMTSAEMVKEANGLAKRVVSSFESRYGGRKVSTRIVRARQNSRAEDRKRDGFPRGFSTVSSNSRLCRMVSGDGLGGDGDREDSSRSIILSFDVEQMGLGIVDESPVYGDRSGLTPENGSFHLNPKNDVVRSDSSDGGEVRLDARLSGATSKKDGRRRRIFSKRRKSAAEKVTPDDGLPIRNHLRADFDSEAERAHGTECDVFTASRLLAKPQATRVRVLFSEAQKLHFYLCCDCNRMIIKGVALLLSDSERNYPGFQACIISHAEFTNASLLLLLLLFF